MEVWKPIPGWEAYYEASSEGRVRSLERMSWVNGKKKGKRKMGGAILVPVRDRRGYLRVSLSADGRCVRFQVHRLVLLAFRGPSPPGHCCRHLNGSPSDNRLENLVWGTPLENMEDRELHGRCPKGQNHHASKLTNEQALYIYQSDEMGDVLAARFGVNKTKISDIRRGRTYRSVTGGIPQLPKSATGRRRTDKLTPDLLPEVCRLREAGMTYREIGARYGICNSGAYLAIKKYLAKTKD